MFPSYWLWASKTVSVPSLVTSVENWHPFWFSRVADVQVIPRDKHFSVISLRVVPLSLFREDHCFLDMTVHEVYLEVSAYIFLPLIPLHQSFKFQGFPGEVDEVSYGNGLGWWLAESAVTKRTTLVLLVVCQKSCWQVHHALWAPVVPPLTGLVGKDLPSHLPRPSGI